jgi:hypothetical protein
MNVLCKILAIASASLALLPAFVQALPHDIVLLLGNSKAMVSKAPTHLLRNAVGGFLNHLSATDRVAILVYDDSTLAIAPFTEVTPLAIKDLLERLGGIPYTSPYSNSASAIERAIYELETHGRNEAAKSIVLLSIEPIDTGDKGRDLEFSRWLEEILVDKARRGGIGIYTIAFGDEADERSLQSMASRTEATLRRAGQGPDLVSVFGKVATDLGSRALRQPSIPAKTPADEPPPIASLDRLSTPGEDENPDRGTLLPPAINQPLADENTDQHRPPVREPPVREPPQPRRRAVVQSQGQTRERGRILDEFWRHPILYSSLTSGAIAAVLSGLVLALRRRARVPATGALPKLILDAQTGGSRVLLEDLNAAIPQKYHRLGGKLTWISRTPVEDNEGSTTVLITRGQVSRKHAVIQRKGSKYWISGREDTHGTYVNDEPVNQERRLEHGDLLRFGDVVFRFLDTKQRNPR